MSGTTPPGTTTEEQAERWVRDMFGRVAPRYDLSITCYRSTSIVTGGRGR